MGYIHVYVVIIFFILATSGDVQISFMKGAPRFNNAMYYDYFFACHTEGEILQWKVNNTNISDYFGQSGIGQVFTRSISNCDYTTTLLSFKLLAMGQSIFDSVLIVSCQNSANLNFDVLCTNGSLSKMTSNSVKETDAEAETIASSVLLEHVLTENVVIADSSNCINIFVCGVDNNFLTIGVNNNNFVFATFNDIGRQDEILRDTTTLESQAILIGRTPYRLIVVMLVIDGAGTNVTCGYDDDNTARMAIMQCPANLETTESGMSTAGDSVTTASPNKINLAAIIIPIVVAVIVIAVIIIAVIFCCKRNRQKKKKETESRNETLPMLELHKKEKEIEEPELQECLSQRHESTHCLTNFLNPHRAVQKIECNDSRCLFYALSHQLTGDTKFYDKVRKDITSFEEKELEVFKAIYMGTGTFEEHLEIVNKGGWTAETEIAAAAALYNKDIYVLNNGSFDKREFFWNKFTRNQNVKSREETQISFTVSSKLEWIELVFDNGHFDSIVFTAQENETPPEKYLDYIHEVKRNLSK